MQEEDYMPVEEAADLLRITTRQARRYQDKVRSKVVGKRLLLHRGDISELARLKNEELQARGEAQKYEERPKRTELIAPGEMLTYLREREAHAERLQQQLVQAAHRIGELESQLAQRLLPQEAAALRQQLADVQQERELVVQERNQLQQHYDHLQQDHQKLQQELIRLAKPWWKRLWRT
jgi:hypothetical protein